MRTEGHPNCLRIALVFFVLTFALCICAVSAQEAARVARGNGNAQSTGMASVPNVADSGHSKFFTATTVGYLALSAEDFYLSNRCIQSGACVEVGSYRGRRESSARLRGGQDGRVECAGRHRLVPAEVASQSRVGRVGRLDRGAECRGAVWNSTAGACAMTRLDALRAIVAQPSAAIRAPKLTQPADTSAN
jgi:hypothetical protein